MKEQGKMRQIAIYGKVGIVKSTTLQKLTATLSTMGNKILLVGCNLKVDSIRMLPGGVNQKKLSKNPI